MIKLSRNRAASSLPKDFIQSKLIKKHEDLVSRFYAARISSSPISFSSAKWKTAKTHLKLDSQDKCAYCEASTAVVAHGDVEHFRPKSLYWWLAYTFDNYVFACQICNQVYKGDSFPILSGNRLPSPRMPRSSPVGARLQRLAASLALDASATTEKRVIARWASEKAALPHPYFQDPEPFIRYASDDANNEVWLLPSARRGAKKIISACETFLGLNREELRRLRFQHYSTFKTLKDCYQSAGLDAALQTNVRAEFKRLTSQTSPFAGMCRFFAREWGLPQ